MRISIIGTGRVAYHLAKVFLEKHQLVQVFSRNKDQDSNLADQFNADIIYDYADVDSTVDLIVIAVSDQSIADVIRNLNKYAENTFIVHTSGSTHLDILTCKHQRSGVFYPLQTFSKERDIDWKTTPLFIESASAQDLEMLKKLADTISDRVYSYSSEQRLSLHLAAVFACNFTNYCYDMAKQVVDAQSVDFSLLYPLIEATAKKALQADPKEMQTGPAMRGDENIIYMHQALLKHAQRPDLAEVYALMSQQILQRHHSS